MSTSHKSLIFSLVTVSILTVFVTAVSLNGQDSSSKPKETSKPQEESKPKEANTVDERIQQLEQRLFQSEKTLNEVLAAFKEFSKVGLWQLKEYKELKALQDHEAQRQQRLRQEQIQRQSTNLKRTYGSAVVIISVCKAGEESEIEGKIDGVEDHLGETFVRITTSNRSKDEALVKWATIAGIKKKSVP